MIVVVNKTNLMKSVNIVSKAVSSKTTLPILECILLTAEDDALTLIGNDMEIGIKTSFEAVVREEGQMAVNARIFAEIIRRLPEEDIRITADEENNITIECGRSKFDIKGQNAVEFPPFPEITQSEALVLPQKAFKDMIKNTIFSIAPEDSGRPILTGELMDIRDGYLYLVAVDGFRISMRRMPVNFSEEKKVTVPGKALNELQKILEAEEDSLMSVRLTGKQAIFEMNQTTVVTRLLEGEFLQYQRNLNMDFTTRVTVQTKELLDSVDRAALISRESKNSPIRLQIENDKIVITSNAEKGSAYEEVEAKLDGEGLAIAFNPRYYLEALKAAESEKVTILFSSSLTPCIIRDEETEDYKYFILPIRLHN